VLCHSRTIRSSSSLSVRHAGSPTWISTGGDRDSIRAVASSGRSRAWAPPRNHRPSPLSCRRFFTPRLNKVNWLSSPCPRVHTPPLFFSTEAAQRVQAQRLPRGLRAVGGGSRMIPRCHALVGSVRERLSCSGSTPRKIRGAAADTPHSNAVTPQDWGDHVRGPGQPTTIRTQHVLWSDAAPKRDSRSGLAVG